MPQMIKDIKVEAKALGPVHFCPDRKVTTSHNSHPKMIQSLTRIPQ